MNLLSQINIGDTFYGSGQNPQFRSLTGVGGLVSLALRIAFVAAGILVLFFVIVGGYSLIASAGTNNPEQAARGKQATTAAVIGFIIVFCAFWIVQLIEALTGVTIL